jgi:hypothetical protein
VGGAKALVDFSARQRIERSAAAREVCNYPMIRIASFMLGVFALAVIAVSAVGYRNATAAPLVRVLKIRVDNYPPGAPPVRIVLFSDVHVHGPDMPPSRVERIVDQINGLHPDIDVAAGDFVGDNWFGAEYSVEEAIAPLKNLKTKLGVYAVLGNNDYEAGAPKVISALHGAGVHVLLNEAVKVGPIALGGLDGRLYYSRAALNVQRQKTYDAMDSTPGVKLLVAHRSDEFVAAPQSTVLVLAGHTHCGQIVLPLFGALFTGSDYGRKYACGIVREASKILVVTAGLGTSHVPFRIGAPPDIWLGSKTSSTA